MIRRLTASLCRYLCLAWGASMLTSSMWFDSVLCRTSLYTANCSTAVLLRTSSPKVDQTLRHTGRYDGAWDEARRSSPTGCAW